MNLKKNNMVNNYSLTQIIKDVFHTIGKKKVLFLLLLTLIASVVEVFGTVSIYPFLDVASNVEVIFANKYYNYFYQTFDFTNPKTFTIYFGAVIFLIFSVTTVISILINYIIIMELQKTSAETSDKILNFLISSGKLMKYKVSSSDILRIVLQDTNRFASTTFSILSLISKIIVLIFFFSILFYTNFKITLFALCTFSVVYILIYKIIQNRLKTNGASITVEQKKRINIVNDITAGIREFTLFNKSEFFLNNFRLASKRFANSVGQNSAITNLPKSVVELFLYLAIIVVMLYIFIFKNYDFKLIIPTLGLYFVIFIRSLPSFQQIYSSYSTIKANTNGLEAIKKEVDFKNLNKKQKEKKEIKIQKGFDLKNISYKYGKKIILNNLNLSVSKGDKIAILGATGSGKTTLINVLLGFFKPDTGKYIIDKKMNVWPNLNIYNNFTFVPQNIFLTNTNIQDNTVFSSSEKKIKKNELQNAMKISGLSSFLKNNKQGLKKRVGERGVSLSGGQMQRLGIARAIYSNREYIIFDEATSALDIQTEKKIINNIFSMYKNKTIVFITHKKSFLKKFNKILELKNGRLRKVI